jgi:opacity protein-like surface antigen
MVSVKSFIPAGAAALISTVACAADLPPPPMVYQPPPAIVEAPGGWYLRGDVGVGIQNFTDFPHFQTNPAFVWPADWTIVQHEIKSATIVGFGIGYELNNWLRFDITGEERSKVVVHVVGRYTDACNTGGGGGTCFDVYNADHSAAVFLANTYIDLGTWWCLTPYIGGGVGAAFNTISGITDLGIIGTSGTTGFGLAFNDASTWTLAWDVTAGLTYNVTNNFKVDFSWRFLDLGSPRTAVVQCQNTPSCPGAFYALKDLTSQDFRIGLRWMLQPAAPTFLAPPPVMSRG